MSDDENLQDDSNANRPSSNNENSVGQNNSTTNNEKAKRHRRGKLDTANERIYKCNSNDITFSCCLTNKPINDNFLWCSYCNLFYSNQIYNYKQKLNNSSYILIFFLMCFFEQFFYLYHPYFLFLLA